MFCSKCGSPCSESDRICPQCGIQLYGEITTKVAPLIKRALLFLEADEVIKADDYCERVLDMDPENAQAYLIKLMIRARVKTEEELANVSESFASWKSYRDVCRFADESLRSRLENYLKQAEEGIRIRQEEAARQAEEELRIQIEQRMSATYMQACRYCKSDARIDDLTKAISLFKQVYSYKDAATQVEQCRQRLDQLKQEKQIREFEQARQEKRRRTCKAIIITCVIMGLLTAIVLIGIAVKGNDQRYELTYVDIGRTNISVSTYAYNYIQFYESEGRYIIEAKNKSNGISTRQTGKYYVDAKGNVSITNDEDPDIDFFLGKNEKCYFKGDSLYLEADIASYGKCTMIYSK